jgi:diaminopimelate epimerase
MKFTKMHGLGNDFIILNNINPSDYDLNALAIKLCDRRTGIGADGIVLVLPSGKADIQMRIINSDGSEPDMCGNAIRCFSRFVVEKGIINKSAFTIETFAGILKPEMVYDGNSISAVKVNMGTPGLNRQNIPMLGNEGPVINEKLEIDGCPYYITSLLMNIPHTMVYTDNVAEVAVEKIGPKIEKASVFPKGTNVNFVEVINPGEIKVRTWERGAGATLACGTGCCASVVSSILNKKTNNKVRVHLTLGFLDIEWDGSDVLMTGPAAYSFSGECL